ncbi:MAG: hypothetical protein KF901_29075 [Myxococcales bacterium]|nr:hypothetical protein [Myxococcales bacterium]
MITRAVRAWMWGVLVVAMACGGDDDAPPTDSGTSPVDGGADGGSPVDGGPIETDGGTPMDGGPIETDGGCPVGMTGPECAECAEGYQDADEDGVCSLGCGAMGDDALDCGDFGECADASGTRRCVCETGTIGDACDACDDGWEEVRGRCTPVLGVLAGLRHWFDADHTSVSTNASGALTSWSDRRGVAEGVELSTSPSSRPIAIEGVWNGRRVIRFSGDTVASAFEGSNAVSTASYTIWIVTRASAGIANQPFFAFRTENLLAVNLRTSLAGYRFIHRSPPLAAGGSQGDQVTVGRSPSAPDIIRVRRRASTANPANHNLHIDVAEDGAFGARNGSLMPLTQPTIVGSHIISLGAIGGDSFGGDIGEVLVFDRALTDAESLQVLAYLHAKWGT